MNRHDRGFHFRYWSSKMDQYAKSYPDFSLGGNQLGEHSLSIGELAPRARTCLALAQNCVAYLTTHTHLTTYT